MKRFVLFILLVLSLSAAVVLVLEYLYRDYKTSADQLFHRFQRRASTVETIYIGNSHIGAFNAVIQDSLSIINMSIGGQDIFRMWAVLDTIVPQSSKLKVVYVGLDYDLIGYNQSKSGQEYIDRQYYKYTGELYNNTPTNRAMSSSAFFRSNRDLAYLFAKKVKDTGEEEVGNFIPLTSNKGNPEECKKRAEEHTLLKFKQANISENLQYLEKIVALCQLHHVALVFINPPKTDCYRQYSNLQTVTTAKSTINTFLLAHPATYRDFYADTTFHDSMFADFDHLNPTGVALLISKLHNP